MSDTNGTDQSTSVPENDESVPDAALYEEIVTIPNASMRIAALADGAARVSFITPSRLRAYQFLVGPQSRVAVGMMILGLDPEDLAQVEKVQRLLGPAVRTYNMGDIPR